MIYPYNKSALKIATNSGILTLLFSLIISVGCDCKTGTRERKRINNQLVEGIFKNDSIYDGVINFYSDKGDILASKTYTNGILNGSAKYFDPNGKVTDSMNFTYGMANGFHYVYRSDGKMEFMGYYANGFGVGPQIFYNNGTIQLFYFMNFEKTSIYEAHYDSAGRVDRFKGQILNVYPYNALLKGKDACGLFLFFIYPPSISIKYSLILKNDSGVQRQISKFNKSKVYLDTVLPIPPPRYRYYFVANVSDSLNSIDRVYVDELNYPDSSSK
jgi:antitoxin component YwqK of YwqJK toxin-antitoxin module